MDTQPYKLAILVDEKDPLSPSDDEAIRRFVKAGTELGVECSIIGKEDYIHLNDYDGLFIRETTDIDNHTFKFAIKAETLGLDVIDDPGSIRKCCDKVFQSNLYYDHNVPTPQTEWVFRGNKNSLYTLPDRLSYPIVLKVPNSSFSRGVVKVNNWEELVMETNILFHQSDVLIAQEYVYTPFDWRIGIIGGEPLFVCKYFMSRGHWQIYNHSKDAEEKSGRFETMLVEDAPKEIVDLALSTAALIGDGFYGVDIKDKDGRLVVIEVNDNPSVESEIEDLRLGDALYKHIIREFIDRRERKYGVR